MAVVGTHVTLGESITLNAADQFTPPVDIGAGAGLVQIAIEFDGSWNGTLTFQGGVKIDGTYVWDSLLATDLVDASTGTTTTGGTTTTEIHRVDASGLAVRVYATTVTAGVAEVTFTIAEG